MGGPSVQTPASEARRLDSWKEIAAYLNRDVTTVQRWEKREGMPVYRHVHDKRGSVYAVPEELDAWQEQRRPALEDHLEGNGSGEIPAAHPSARGAYGWGSGRVWWVVAAVVVCVGLVGYVVWHGRARATAEPRIRSLAVLPLRNLSGDPSQDYLADGITEELIGKLAGIRELKVTSHTSVMRFKDPKTSVPEIAKALGVDAVVEGSVIREGSRIRVSAQLIRAATDTHLWSETYDQEMSDALTLESDLAQSIAEKVRVTVTGEEQQRLTATRAVAPEVYESYLKGMYALHGRGRAGQEQSVVYFNDALSKDPTFAPAYVGLAETYTWLGTVAAGASPAETRPKVMSAARKAIELDPDLAEAHVLLANSLQEQWQWAAAETEYKRALELQPNDAGAHSWYALWLSCQGRTDEAVDWIRRARELDPVSVSGASVAWILFQAHRFDEAIREARDTLAVRPDDPGALGTLGFALLGKGQAEEAIPVLEKADALSKGSPAVEGILVRAYALGGRREDALRLLAKLKTRRAAGYFPAAAFVNAYLGLGDKEQAFVWLEQAFKEQSNILQFVKTHPFFDPIRSDPRFVDLERRIGLG
jgi:TolB-like protein/Flp pilus assembly protein TadD